jgi:type I restriction enzyme, R subunit
MSASSRNFGFLAAHDPLLVRIATLAELRVEDDPNSAIIKLRQFSEALLQHAAARVNVESGPQVRQVDLIRTLADEGLLGTEVADLFHVIRRSGNDAAHAFTGTPGEAVHLLKIARELAVWFHRTFGNDSGFRPGAFVPPARPVDTRAADAEQVEQLRAEVEAERLRAEEAGFAAEVEAEQRRLAEEEARRAADERETALQMAGELEALLSAERARFTAELTLVRRAAAAREPGELQETVERARVAESAIELDEAATRRLIDQQLRDAGWEADSETLRWSRGARPQAGCDLAIAEVPTATGPADYVLFAGRTPVGVVEAKRQTASSAAWIEQAKRYARGYTLREGEESPGGPWGEYRIPFLFATNGRPFLRQVQDRTGIWFLDARRSTNHPRPLLGWYSPEGLRGLLKQDTQAATQALQASPVAEMEGLRDYQQRAITAVESAMAEGRRSVLLAMATGTGKTRTLVALIYRLLKAGRFRRVLFLVDRTALGEQALGTFTTLRPEGGSTFSEIYEVGLPDDVRPGTDTRLHIATVQAMVRRVLGAAGAADEAPPPVDTYDLVVVDECHRGYSLDREMTDAELTFRSEADYISRYRRVLDHFDTVRVGLTATPAQHTTLIFGDPVYTYSYREAVVDGWLVDHEPAERIVTALAEDGITWMVNEAVQVFDPRSGELDLVHAPDEIRMDVDTFNRRVLSENFNRVVCEHLASQIDPRAPGKTLVFCVNDNHAQTVVRLLKEAFEEAYGEVEEAAVARITSDAMRADNALVRRFKNEALPVVAVTVDLLSTGIDVPEIVNIVFLRRVRSRILYEQMLGRATRRSPNLYGPGLDKFAFRVFDAVDLYGAMQSFTDMQPVLPRPSTSFAELVDELAEVPGDEARREILDQLAAKLQRKARRLEARFGPELQELAGMPVGALGGHLHGLGPDAALDFLTDRPALLELLDRGVDWRDGRLLISEHEDELRRVEHGYGNGRRPQDYLEEFREYVRTHINEIPALAVVLQRPRDLTRAQLKELRRALDGAGFSETRLRAAWRDARDQDIAASIIGYVRGLALGSPLEPYEDRVQRAMSRIRKSRSWNYHQLGWLRRIELQLMQQHVIDREVVDSDPFRAEAGGFQRLDRTFDGRLDEVLHQINEEVWRDSA